MATFVPISYLALKCVIVLERSNTDLKTQFKRQIKTQRLQRLKEKLTLLAGVRMGISETERSLERYVSSSTSKNQQHQQQQLSNPSYQQTRGERARTDSIVIVDSKVKKTNDTNINCNNKKNPAQKSGKLRKGSDVLIDSSKGSNIRTKIIISATGITFIALGILIMSLTFGHFDKYSNTCSNPGSPILSKNPELIFWSDCLYKTMPFVNGENSKISCNCRKVQIDISNQDIDSKNASIALESMLSNWDQLELFYISDTIQRYSVNLTKSSHYNSKYLRVLHAENIVIHSLSEYIDNWSNLEYFAAYQVFWPNWPENFKKLNKISYLQLINFKYIDDLPPNICQMENLRALYVSFSSRAKTALRELPNCFAELPILQSVQIFFSQLRHIPLSLFTHPTISEIALAASNLTLDVFVTSADGGYDPNMTFRYDDELFYQELLNDTDYWDWGFAWNPTSETTFYLGGSFVCYQYTDDHGYAGQQKYFPEKVWQFLNETEACSHACTDEFAQTCEAFDWQNGVCNEECNVASCEWDGGDCNQLCIYYNEEIVPGSLNLSSNYNISGDELNRTGTCDLFTMFENGVCDIGCNNSYCSWDSGDCDFNNGTYCNSYNYSSDGGDNYNNDYNISDLYLCKYDWVDDGWCDNNCRHSESCSYDGDDCDCSDGSLCYEYYTKYFTLIGSYNPGGSPYAELDEVCAYWQFLSVATQGVSAVVDEWLINNVSCSEAFKQLDTNNDSLIDPHELIYVFYEILFIPFDKVIQINCTNCVT